jgi:hypothetical protein
VATERPKRDALAAIGTNRARVATADADLERAVATAIHWGATWAEIADGLGVTRQSAHERYRQLRYGPATGAAWHEPPSRSDIPAPPSPFTYHDPTVHPSLDLAVAIGIGGHPPILSDAANQCRRHDRTHDRTQAVAS